MVGNPQYPPNPHGPTAFNTTERQERRAADLADAVCTYYTLRAKAAAKALLRNYRHPAGIRDDWDWRSGRVEFTDVPMSWARLCARTN